MRRRYRYDAASGEMREVAAGIGSRGTLIMTDLPGYQSPVTGNWIEGRRARREDLARSGCRPYEGRAQEAAQIRREEGYRQAKVEQRLERNVRETLAQMPARVRRDLIGRN